MTRKRVATTHRAWLFILLTQATLVALAFARLHLVRQSVQGADECFSCQASTLIQHESGLWVLVWLLLTLASTQIRAIRILFISVLWSLILVLLADIFTLQQFGLRLYLADVLKFGQQPQFFVDYMHELLGWLWIPLLFTVIIALPWFTSVLTRRLLVSWQARTGLLLMAGLSLLLYSLPDRTSHPLPWTYLNLLEANWPGGVNREFSPQYLEELISHPPPSLTKKICTTGQDIGGDVIIVAVESLSAYHSELLLPGPMNVVPLLDAAARQNSWWDRFYANGFTTDHGLIALLTGQLPVPAVNRYSSIQVFEGYEGNATSLPKRLAEDGYFSAFLTSGDLDFLGKGDWLKTLGFDHIEGSEQSDYTGAERFGFGAVSDDLLFQRTINWLKNERPGSRPVVAFVETVTTHPPFIDPVSGQASEAAAFRFTDRALADFVADLEDLDYFRNGLLMITSDQRSLTPISPEETAAFGAAAGARLPLVVMGGQHSLTGAQSTPAQMTDLPYSLDHYLTAQACHRPGQGNLFTGQAPDCIYQADGNQRNVIHAFCGMNTAKIKMDGDKTRVIEGVLPDAQRRIRELNYLRAQLGVKEANLRILL
ncbi:MAG: LTA synthase family protein [Gammaproteobacteria bacterium]|nr:LTA synthase family protein [Gammaproteobacteria bacterium]